MCNHRVACRTATRYGACMTQVQVGISPADCRPGLRSQAASPHPYGGFMRIANRAVLVTGANRGIGQALVTAALRRGAERVYAGTRQRLAHPHARVTPLTLDVTSPAPIQAAVEKIESLDVLINN